MPVARQLQPVHLKHLRTQQGKAVCRRGGIGLGCIGHATGWWQDRTRNGQLKRARPNTNIAEA